jgi:hypothetical protein
MKRIKVFIRKSDISGMSPDMQEMYFLNKLKKAGIPVKGVLCFKGVETGVLKKSECFDTDEIIYTWEGPDKDQ